MSSLKFGAVLSYLPVNLLQSWLIIISTGTLDNV
jgi:hypothetical protein